MNEAPTVTIGDRTETLVEPSPLAAMALSRSAEDLEDTGLRLALGACALRECWPEDRAWLVKQRPRPYRPGQRPEALGADIFDALARAEKAAGRPINALLDACVAAYNFAGESILTEADLRAAEDFSGAPVEGAG